jgi:hypothetical protein
MNARARAHTHSHTHATHTCTHTQARAHASLAIKSAAGQYSNLKSPTEKRPLLLSRTQPFPSPPPPTLSPRAPHPAQWLRGGTQTRRSEGPSTATLPGEQQASAQESNQGRIERCRRHSLKKCSTPRHQLPHHEKGPDPCSRLLKSPRPRELKTTPLLAHGRRGHKGWIRKPGCPALLRRFVRCWRTSAAARYCQAAS